MTVPFDEATVLKLFSQGDPDAFRLIYEHYAPRVAQVSYRLLRSQEQAEDLMQEVFIKVWLERERFAQADNFRSYLFTCVRNRALDCIKQRGREDAVRAMAASLKNLNESSVDDFIRDKELAQLVNQAVEELPAQRKRVFTMMKDEGLSHQDIAEQLNITPVTVKNHIYEARVFIWQRIEQHMVASVYLALSASLISEAVPF